MTELFQIGIFPLILTLAAFRVGQLCQAKCKNPLLNPILIGMLLVIAFLLATGMDIAVYKSGASSISWLMTPATIALAIPMYEQFLSLRKNLRAIGAGVAAGAVSCIVMMVLGGVLLNFDRSIVISLMPKSVTTAIGVVLSDLFGGMGAVTTASIIITGIFANMMGPAFCKLFRISHPVAQGVAFGTAGHVIGTAKANELNPLTGAVSSLSLVVAGLLTAVLFPIMTKLL
jgi:putative effector of murein hydrolase